MKYRARFREETKGLYPRKYDRKIYGWLSARYGLDEAEGIWDKVQDNYLANLRDLPDLGGSRNGHASAIYGGLLVFSLYPALPDSPDPAELQSFVQEMFMEPFTMLGKAADLNRSFFMRLIDKVFMAAGKRDRRDILTYPDGFVNVSFPYDSERRASMYMFTQCPNAEFAKKHGLLHVLPLLCNSDFYGISEIHGQLIRCGTCGNSDRCDYMVVGDRSPEASQYVTVKDAGGFLVSRKRYGSSGTEKE